MKKTIVRLLPGFIAVLLVSAMLVFILLDRSRSGLRTATPDRPATASENVSPGASQAGRVQDGASRSFFDELIGAGPSLETQDTWIVGTARVLFRFLGAALLAAALAFRWRRGISLRKRNPYVAQTQILLAVVAAAMMMIVGDSAARAFGIFAAASLVRFRTNIRDPKETTVLLVCLGVGLASGVGRLDMGITLAVFVLATLWLLELFEEKQIFRSMEICVETLKTEQSNEILKRVFDKHNFDIELRQMDHEDEEDPLGKIVYLVNLSTTASTDELSAEILAADSEKNIDKVEWEQKKSSTYIYQ